MSREIEDAMIRLGWSPAVHDRVWVRPFYTGIWTRARVLNLYDRQGAIGSVPYASLAVRGRIMALGVPRSHLRPRVGDRKLL